jgi:hypothetical protein
MIIRQRPSSKRAKSISDAVVASFTSLNECDRNGEAANITDGLFAIARALNRIASAIEGLPASSNGQCSGAAESQN